MARSRNIKPGMAKNEYLAQCSIAARYLFALLPTIADREGRLEDRPLRIKGELFPYDDMDVNALLDELADCTRPQQDHPFVMRYEVAGARYIQIVKFRGNQSPHKEEKPSEIPEPPGSITQVPCKPGASTQQPAGSGLKESGIRNQESEKRGVEAPDFGTQSLNDAVRDWLKYKAERREGYKPTGLKAFFTQVSNLADKHGVEAVVTSMQTAMANGWRGFNHSLKDGSPDADPRGNLAVREKLLAEMEQ